MIKPMLLLRALSRVADAVGSGLGYALLVGTVASSPFVVMLRLQPPCNQAEGVCEDGGLGLGAVSFFWLGMMVGFVMGMVLSIRRKSPISNVIRKVASRLDHARPAGRTVGIVVLVTLVGTTIWFGRWVLVGRGDPPPVSLDIEIPLNEALRVGLARVETFHQGGGCVRFGAWGQDAPTSHSIRLFEISSTRSSEICPGVNEPETQDLLIVVSDEFSADPTPPRSQTPVEVSMAPNWYDVPTFGAVSIPSPTPVVVELDGLSGVVDDDALVWRITVANVGDGFAVPVINAVEGETEIALRKINESGRGSDPTSHVGRPAWSHACDRHTCSLGWALVASPSEPNGVQPTRIEMEIWLFDTNSDPALSIDECALVAERRATVDCTGTTE